MKVLDYYKSACVFLGFISKKGTSLTKSDDGVFPKDYQSLINLPGVGDYTASAISSICNNEKAVVHSIYFRGKRYKYSDYLKIKGEVTKNELLPF